MDDFGLTNLAFDVVQNQNEFLSFFLFSLGLGFVKLFSQFVYCLYLYFKERMNNEFIESMNHVHNSN